ncbi:MULTISPECIES: PLP-dependent aminotransferase family protein [Hyphomicrobiales]|jgi:DNA-binding transcriptional MocR family regulator|uniref:aminotransferase-like domain-containing protein n=1 Tax=Hyphomicrobiales TaxID=356 RepID=UPI0003645B8F|nr:MULTISPECIES: PLP-dependent aminotransferase family protein [Phyllobacteriaceae]MCX8568021.1 PLP-dependent aminotransferase family protein [Aminobacter sp. MET-1]
MTIWLPDLSSGSGPLYLRLAERIENDIDSGVLASGAKLPPQRNLAYDIGVTIGTVGRAYALLRERGLVSGEVGRGTYVLERGGSQPALSAPPTLAHEGSRTIEAPSGKLHFDSTAAPNVDQGGTIETILAAISRDNPDDMTSYTRTFPEHWFEAGSTWLSRNGFRPAPDTIVPTLGAHAAVVATIAALTQPGDHILFEHVTYTQIARSAGLIGRRMALVNSDADGVDPDDFEAVCAQKHPKLAFLMPTAQNPTCVTMPSERRAAIAAIARKYNVLLVEDDLYGALTDDRTPLLAEFAPERVIVVGGLSKSVAAGVRGGWVSCPAHFRHSIRVAHKMVTGGMPFLLAELCAQLVLSGDAAAIRARAIAEINWRLDAVRKALGGYDFNINPNIPFIWLALPEPWNSGTFKNAAYGQGVLVDDEDEFKAGRSDQVFHRVRIGVSAPRTRAEVDMGLAKLRRLLDEGDAGYDSFG